MSALFDAYATGVQPAPGLVLGTFEPHQGKFRLRIDAIGANQASTGAKYLWGLDCVVPEQP
jgi:hypothetical protein